MLSSDNGKVLCIIIIMYHVLLCIILYYVLCIMYYYVLLCISYCKYTLNIFYCKYIILKEKKSVCVTSNKSHITKIPPCLIPYHCPTCCGASALNSNGEVV